jgi:hypothetical protein
VSARRAVPAVAVTALAALLLTCGKGDPVQPPTPGWVNLRLTTPNTDDGGILFVVSGPQVDSVRSAFANTFLRREGAGSVRVVIVGSLSAGVIGQVLVPDTRAAAGYSATVVEVAARGTFAQRAVNGYAVTVEAAP